MTVFGGHFRLGCRVTAEPEYRAGPGSHPGAANQSFEIGPRRRCNHGCDEACGRWVAARGSVADAFEPQIRALLVDWQRMPSQVIAERIGGPRCRR